MRAASPGHEIPSYLKDYEKLFAENPPAAGLQWFRDAKFGLFMHYGLYSLEGRHEWLQFREKIPVATYAKLKDRFTAEKFDADFITDLALAAQMRYVNLTTRHHDGFCLFATKQTDFNSVNSPAKRDLVAELAAACRKKGLGLCLYYSHRRDWRHPHAPNNDAWGGSARPAYNPPEPAYATGKEHDLNKYLDFMKAQITELLTNYGPIAAIWLDGIMVPLMDKTKKPCPKPADQDLGDDPDGDGIPNAVENFFGTNPGVPSGGLVAGKVSGNNFTFTHPQNATPASDPTASYRWSKDLASFLAGGAADGAGTTVTFTTQTNNPAPGFTTVTATVTGTTTPKLFFRVAVPQS